MKRKSHRINWVGFRKSEVAKLIKILDMASLGYQFEKQERRDAFLLSHRLQGTFKEMI